MPSKAIVLAAGLGTRLIPLSRQTPKTLMPLWGKPLLASTLDGLERWGVREVLVNLHHAPGLVLDFVRSRQPTGLRIHLSFEPEILGTGGALRKAEWFLDDDCFWIINGDIVVDVDPIPFVRLYRQMRPMAVLWLHDTEGPRTVDMADHIISSFHSPAPGSRSTYTFCGLHLASRRILSFIPPNTCSSIIDAYARSMNRGNRVAGLCPRRSFWADIGTAAGYLDAHRRTFEAARSQQPGSGFLPRHYFRTLAALKRHGVTTRGWVSVGRNVRMARGSQVRDSVIWDGAALGRGTVLDQAIVGDAATVTGHLRGIALRADRSDSPSLLLALERIGWPPGETTAMPLAPRGSARTFTRIRKRTSSAIVIEYSLERPENGLYVQNAKFLRRLGVRVPRILLDLPDDRIVVTEDAGNCSLGDRIAGKTGPDIVAVYESVIKALAPLYRAGKRLAAREGLTLCEPFSDNLYRWERELFASHYLKGRLRLSAPVIRGAMLDLKRVARALQDEPQVLIHRDLQSSNILFCRREPVFIDFQSMRIGPQLYDLASLVCDPYVCLPEPVQFGILALCGNACQGRTNGFTRRFWTAAVERLIQALGAFARMGRNPETADFARHIRPTLKMLDRALQYVDDLPHLRRIVDGALAQRGE